MSVQNSIRRAFSNPAVAFTGGTALLILSGVLLYAHATTLEQVSGVSVPLAAELPQLERTDAILKEQVELAELESASTVGSIQERVRMYILPEQTNLDRVVATFEVMRNVLEKRGALGRMSELTFGDRQNESQPLSVSFTVDKSGMQDIIALVRLSGIMTIADALKPEELDLLIEHTEAENPAGIVAVEQFLSTDLLSYAQNPRVAEDRLLRSFSSTQFVQTLQSITHTSLLQDAIRILSGDMSREFDRYQLWPVQFMSLDNISIVPGSVSGWFTLTLELQLHTRES